MNCRPGAGRGGRDLVDGAAAVRVDSSECETRRERSTRRCATRSGRRCGRRRQQHRRSPRRRRHARAATANCARRIGRISGAGGIVVDGAQPGIEDVRVDLRRRQVRVTEHHLDGAQVGAALEQVRRERMAQDVRAQRRGRPGLRAVRLAGSSRSRRASARLPPRALTNSRGDDAPLEQRRPRLARCSASPTRGLVADRHQPLLAPLARARSGSRSSRFTSAGRSADHLRHAQAGRVEQLDHRAVAQPARRGDVRRASRRSTSSADRNFGRAFNGPRRADVVGRVRRRVRRRPPGSGRSRESHATAARDRSRRPPLAHQLADERFERRAGRARSTGRSGAAANAASSWQVAAHSSRRCWATAAARPRRCDR